MGAEVFQHQYTTRVRSQAGPFPNGSDLIHEFADAYKAQPVQQ